MGQAGLRVKIMRAPILFIYLFLLLLVRKRESVNTSPSQDLLQRKRMTWDDGECVHFKNSMEREILSDINNL